MENVSDHNKRKFSILETVACCFPFAILSKDLVEAVYKHIFHLYAATTLITLWPATAYNTVPVPGWVCSHCL